MDSYNDSNGNTITTDSGVTNGSTTIRPIHEMSEEDQIQEAISASFVVHTNSHSFMITADTGVTTNSTHTRPIHEMTEEQQIQKVIAASLLGDNHDAVEVVHHFTKDDAITRNGDFPHKIMEPIPIRNNSVPTGDLISILRKEPAKKKSLFSNLRIVHNRKIKKTKQKSKASVSFDSSPPQMLLDPIIFTPEEVQSVWYTKHDFFLIKKENYKTAETIRATGRKQLSDIALTRGIEHLIDISLGTKRGKQIHLVAETCLKKQQEQAGKGITPANPKTLRQSVKMFTDQAANVALNIASSDRSSVIEYIIDVKDMNQMHLLDAQMEIDAGERRKKGLTLQPGKDLPAVTRTDSARHLQLSKKKKNGKNKMR
mmetsp:Transcript_20843/g.23961  ORF Transcript_20843/g.23961 Transcript_20843/m.23961 type:complete len:370 (-) Transcript_20843:511-1620(-)